MNTAPLQEARRLPRRSAGTAVTVVRDRINLAAFVPQWEDLAAHAIEPNPLYEHWMLLPALEGLAPGEGIRCVLVWIDGREGRRSLGGLFPLLAPAWYKGLPIGVLKSYRYAHWPLCTPLVRAGVAERCLHALLDWFSRDGEGASLLELDSFPRDGALHGAMAQVLHEREQMAVATDRSLCARLRADGGGAAGQPLAAESAVTTRVLRPGDDPQPWIRDFLALDRSAEQRSAARVMREAHRRGRLLMVAVDVGGRPASCAAAVTAGEGVFAFRTAVDESFADPSFRVAAEAERMKRVHALPALRWMDSLTPADSFLCRLWGGARLLQTLLISDGAWGSLATSGMPLWHWGKRRMP